jgi:hypothetical protein
MGRNGKLVVMPAKTLNRALLLGFDRCDRFQSEQLRQLLKVALLEFNQSSSQIRVISAILERGEIQTHLVAKIT